MRVQLRRIVISMGIAVSCLSCDKNTSYDSRSAAVIPVTNHPVREAPRPIHLDHAQPRLRTMQLWLGTNAITAELAMSRVEIATGMMFRESMGEDEGMLFVFGTPHQTGFYMKNTKVPLSVAYIDPEGVIAEIHDLKPLDENPVIAQSSNILYVLELNQGWFDRHGIGVGAAIATERGSLKEVFFPNRN